VFGIVAGVIMLIFSGRIKHLMGGVK
jgi:hypothetical protein